MVVEPQRTSSNLYKPLQYRESKVCRGLSHAFEVVRLYRTFSNHILTRGSRCVGYLYTCSGWFNRSEPPRTFSNHFSAARCVEVYHMSSGWFDSTEPHLHKEIKVCSVPIHLFRVVEPQRTSANLYKPLHYRESKVCRGLSHAFEVV